MHPKIVAAVQSILPIKAVATFEDPAVDAASQLVTVLAVSVTECRIVTRNGDAYTLDSLCVNLHSYAG